MMRPLVVYSDGRMERPSYGDRRMHFDLLASNLDPPNDFHEKILYFIYIKVQVSSEYKMCSRIFEPPPPTAQTEHARDPKFCMIGPQGTRLRVTEAIFDKLPLSRDLGVAWGTPGGGQKSSKFFFRFFDFFRWIRLI